MRTGVSYMGHHNPRHIATDIADMKSIGLDDVLLAAQENDFVWMVGKCRFLPEIAREQGIRPIAIFWGVLNLFGGGRSSQFLLENPSGHQVRKDGSWNPAGCYNNPLCVSRIKEMIDLVAEWGFEGYFIDEPAPLDCYCESCGRLYEQRCGGDLRAAEGQALAKFRQDVAFGYIENIAAYVKANHPQMETMCCVWPWEQELLARTTQIDGLDNCGTDIYWVNDDRDVEEMTPLVRELARCCAKNGKKHHEWLQAWDVRAGNEQRITAQGEILLRESPDGLYVWAYEGQVGTAESSDDAALAWAHARAILEKAKAR